MGHQHHFLSRLDRVSAPHVELALSLYRDVDLLRYVLDHAHLPEGTERVAISLDHPSNGPFLVVTRDGHFVTCLGAGMSAGDRPIITRGQLDGIAAKASVLRERLEACMKLAGERGGLGKLLMRIYEAADELSREEIVAISALQPIYAPEFFNFFFILTDDVNNSRERLVRTLRKTDRLNPQYREALRGYWNYLWAIGHLSVLSAMDGPAFLDRFPPGMAEMKSEVSPSWSAVGHGVFGLALKGIWCAGRVGKALLPGYKRRFAAADSELTILDAAMGLAAIGARHARLRAEVEKVLAAGIEAEEGPLKSFLESIALQMGKFVKLSMDSPEGAAAIQRSMGAQGAVRLGKALPEGSPYRFERPEDVPEDLAMALVVSDQSLIIGDGMRTAAPMLFSFVPWVARAEPEALYLPQDYLRAIHTPWVPEMTLHVLRAHRDYYRPIAPERPEGPSRSGPCPCGSGKKYKRCCWEKED